MTTTIPPEPAKSQGEIILEKIDNLFNAHNVDIVTKIFRIILMAAKIAFRFVPMKADEKNAYNDIVGTADEILNLK